MSQESLRYTQTPIYIYMCVKNDHIHIYLHNNNTKRSSIILCFFINLIAPRICSSKYLNDEFSHIENPFLNLRCSKSFIHFAKSKVPKIRNKNQPRTNAYSKYYKTLPNNSSSHSLINNFHELDFKTNFLPSKNPLISTLKSSTQHIG